MRSLYEKLLKVSPWITIVLPAVTVVAICLFHLAFIKLVIPATLVFLFMLSAYSVFRWNAER